VNGCTLKHVELKDFMPKAVSSDREQLRKAVHRSEIAGTNKVPNPGPPPEAGRSTVRNNWWWHEGDPELSIAKARIFQRHT
jgi:hypothetical protein